MSLSTHVLDTAAGRPAAGVAVRLERYDGLGGSARAKPTARADGWADGWTVLARAVTDADGRVASLPLVGSAPHRLVFDTAARSTFFPEVTITFQVTDPAEHHHIPLLLAPYSYSTYRGS